MQLELEDGTVLDRFDFIDANGSPSDSIVRIAPHDNLPTTYFYEYGVRTKERLVGADNKTSVADFAREVGMLLTANQEHALRLEYTRGGVGIQRILPPGQHVGFVVNPDVY